MKERFKQYIIKRIAQEKKELMIYSVEIEKNPKSALTVIIEEKQKRLHRFETKLNNMEPETRNPKPETRNLQPA